MQGGRGRDVLKISAQTFFLRKRITLSLVVWAQAEKMMSRRVNRHGNALTLLRGVKAGCLLPPNLNFFTLFLCPTWFIPSAGTDAGYIVGCGRVMGQSWKVDLTPKWKYFSFSTHLIPLKPTTNNAAFIQLEALSLLRGDFHLLRFISEHHLTIGGKNPTWNNFWLLNSWLFGWFFFFFPFQYCFLGLICLLECAFFLGLIGMKWCG